jgi:hypothetical protein
MQVKESSFTQQALPEKKSMTTTNSTRPNSFSEFPSKPKIKQKIKALMRVFKEEGIEKFLCSLVTYLAEKDDRLIGIQKTSAEIEAENGPFCGELNLLNLNTVCLWASLVIPIAIFNKRLTPTRGLANKGT